MLDEFKDNLELLPHVTISLPTNVKEQKISPKDHEQFVAHLKFFIPFFCRPPSRILQQLTDLKDRGLDKIVQDLHSLTRGNIKVWHGTIGEVIATANILCLTDYVVPVFKLRFAPNRTMAMHGDDLLGFKFTDEGKPKALLILEAKNYLHNAKQAVQAANETLLKVKNSSPILFDFIINELHSQGKLTEAQLVERFLDEYNYKYRKDYHAFIVTDAKSWDDSYLTEVNPTPAIPLTIMPFLITDWKQVQESLLLPLEEKILPLKFPGIKIDDSVEIKKLLENKEFQTDHDKLASAALSKDLQVEHRERIKYKFDLNKIEKAADFLTISALRLFDDETEQALLYLKEAAVIHERLSVWNLENRGRETFIRDTIDSAFLYSIAGGTANARVLIERIITEENVDNLKLPNKFYIFLVLLISNRLSELKDSLGKFFYEFPPKVGHDEKIEKESMNLIADKISDTSDYLIAKTFAELTKYINTGDVVNIKTINKYLNLSIKQFAIIGDYEAYSLVVIFKRYFETFLVNSTMSILGKALGKIDEEWKEYLRYLTTLGKFPMLTLWKSQQIAVNEGLLENKSLLISMPTSAGKTKTIELVIFKTLKENPDKICIYVVPTRALAAEVEDNLSNNLRKMKIGISVLYGGYDFNPLEEELIKENRVFVLTPEKLDLLLRTQEDFKNKICLIVIDEVHDSASTSIRSFRTELILSRLFYIAEKNKARIICLSAVIQNPSDFAKWISGNEDNKVETEWRPTKQRYGLFEWFMGTSATVKYLSAGNEYPREEFYVPLLFKKSELKGNDKRNIEIAARLGIYYSKTGPTLIFTTTKPLVGEIVKELLGLMGDASHAITPEEKAIIKSCESILGPEHMMVKAMKHGFCYHHADLPRNVRKIVENAVRNNVISLIVSTTTLSQGVNLPIKNVIVHSLWLGNTISMPQFWNAVGRAGRAGHETEGHIIFCNEHDLYRVATEADKYKCESFIASGLNTLFKSRLSSIKNIPDFVEKWALASTPQFRKDGGGYSDWKVIKRRNAERAKESILSTLDSQLLAWIIETAVGEITDEEIKIIFGKLLCSVQTLDIQDEIDEFKVGIKNRAIIVKNKITNEKRRNLFNMTGLAINSNEIIANYAEALVSLIENFIDIVELPGNFWETTYDVLRKIPEFESISKKNHKKLLIDWIKGTNYRDIAHIYFEDDIENAVKTIEEICFSMPWGLNSLIQHLKFILGKDNLPIVFNNLPSFVFNGVPNSIAVYGINLGLVDRQIVIALSKYYIDSYPNNLNFKGFKRWLFDISKEELTLICNTNAIKDFGRIDDCYNIIQIGKDISLSGQFIMEFMFTGDDDITKIKNDELIIIKKDEEFWLTTYEYDHWWQLSGENLSRIRSVDRQIKGLVVCEVDNASKSVSIKVI